MVGVVHGGFNVWDLSFDIFRGGGLVRVGFVRLGMKCLWYTKLFIA